MNRITYTAAPVMTDGQLADVRIHVEGKTWHMWGRNGLAREQALADSVKPGTLPVLVGGGLGHCISLLRKKGMPVAVIDRENGISTITEIPFDHETILIDADTPDGAYRQLEEWRAANGGAPLHLLVIPLYPRLDRAYYAPLIEAIKASTQTDFWSAARYPKFASTRPKLLFFDANYFLCKEIHVSLERMGIEYRTIRLKNRTHGSQDFIESILKAVVEFQPDFALTVNHFGLDRQGKLSGLLEELGLPLASWFVDNPHLVLYDHVHPGKDNTVIFTFDAGNVNELRHRDFQHVHFLPLGTDPGRFRPNTTKPLPAWNADVSFVGNSMETPVQENLTAAALPSVMLAEYQAVAREFGESGELGVAHFLERCHPQWLKMMAGFSSQDRRLATESLLTWEATRQYRLSCVEATLPFSPVIVGDSGWERMLPTGHSARLLEPLDYYHDLPSFYSASKINFNCTSRQMKGAVNQRVFDVPACGGFLLTDHREQMEDLFDLETEAVVYRDIEEIPGLIEELLADPAKRRTIATAARKRILAEHTYDRRMERLLSTMRDTFR